MNNLKIGIIGLGIVGNAIYQFVKKSKLSVIGYDKIKEINSLSDCLGTEILFLCLPTPYNNQIFSFDLHTLNEVCQQLSDKEYSGLVIIKSTVEPGTSENLAKKYQLSIIHNPEFLSTSTAIKDFEQQNHIVLGLTSNIKMTQKETMTTFYSQLFPKSNISVCDAVESESMKLFCNNFYAIKIQFFNELYLLCQKINCDFERVKNLMLKNNWINAMHTQVPGSDGHLSYGGLCFPKDTQALLSCMKKQDSPHLILESCIKERDIIRRKEENKKIEKHL